MSVRKELASVLIEKVGFEPDPGYYDRLRDTVKEVAAGLGFHVVPVIPYGGVFTASDGSDPCRGKAPSRWNSDGRAFLLSESLRNDYIPDHTKSSPVAKLLKTIEMAEKQQAPLGLGCMGREGSVFLDFDSKNFDANGEATPEAVAACDAFVKDWLKKHNLDTYAERSPTGGWHIGLDVVVPDQRSIFTIKDSGLAKLGEVLWHGQHVVIAPTKNGVGSYERCGPPKFQRINSLTDIGIEFATADPDLEGVTVEVANQELEKLVGELRQPFGTEGVPVLSSLMRSMSRDLLHGSWRTDTRFHKAGGQPDRSKVVVCVLNEYISWCKWLGQKGLPFVDDVCFEAQPGGDHTLLEQMVSDLHVAGKFERIADSALLNYNRLGLISKRFPEYQAELNYKRACRFGKKGEALKADDAKTPALLSRFLGQAYGDRLRWNELRFQVELDGRAPEHPELFYFQLEEDFGVETVKSTAIDAVKHAATANAYNPVVEYLDMVRSVFLPGGVAAEGVDLVPIDEIGLKFFGVRDPFQSMLLGKHLIAAAIRGEQPGTPYQQVLVLRGKQGVGKSTSIAALAPDPTLYVSGDEVPGDKDLLMQFAASWHFEFSEFDRFTSARSAGQLKSLISRDRDTFRAPYDPRAKEHPRRCVLWGTTNVQGFLHDPTGERRYWVVDVEDPIDVARVAAERDTIWASVLAAINDGHTQKLAPDQYEQSNQNSQTASEVSLYLDQIQPVITGKPWVTERELLCGRLGLDPAELSRRGPKSGVIREVHDSLVRLGWHRAKQSVRGLPGAEVTRDIWFAPDVKQTRSGPQLIEMFRERGLKPPKFSPITGRLCFDPSPSTTSVPPELTEAQEDVA